MHTMWLDMLHSMLVGWLVGRSWSLWDAGCCWSLGCRFRAALVSHQLQSMEKSASLGGTGRQGSSNCQFFFGDQTLEMSQMSGIIGIFEGFLL